MIFLCCRPLLQAAPDLFLNVCWDRLQAHLTLSTISYLEEETSSATARSEERHIIYKAIQRQINGFEFLLVMYYYVGAQCYFVIIIYMLLVLTLLQILLNMFCVPPVKDLLQPLI